MRIPKKEKDLVAWALDVIAICRVSAAVRASAYRSYGQWIETGMANGGLGKANLLSAHLKRLQAHIFSPTDLHFSIDFENHYSTDTLKQAETASRVLTREWERRNIDTTFAQGVEVALSYGAAIPKLLVNKIGGPDSAQYQITCRLTSPWNFGVYNEALNGMDYQEAVVETVYLSKHEVWRRIAHLPDADKLFKTIVANANKDASTGGSPSFMHQVLSTAVLDINLQNATSPTPGGIVQLSSDPNYATLGPEIAADLIPMHEIWALNDATNDYTTIQIIEPNILVAPRAYEGVIMKQSNLFCPDTLPYGLIQPNRVSNYFWGRSEIVDLMMLQNLMNDTLDNTDRLYKAQFDKILGFVGFDGITDEVYDQMRAGGYVGMPQGSDIKDMTPKLPEQCLSYIQLIEQLFDRVAGFPNVLSGKGEGGVRSGSHADVLMRNASPKLRDMALLVERQCATLADKTLAAMEAKDARIFWIGPNSDESTDFLLSQLPEDRRVTVDSHSSSPVYLEDHQQLIAFGMKADLIGPEDAIDMLPFQNKDRLKQSLQKREEAKAQLIQQHPELLEHGKKKK